MAEDFIATSTTVVAANRDRVWNALIDPATVRQYMFGTTVESTWEPGAAIAWKGEWKGKPYEDKGIILEFVPEQRLSYSHFSPMSGKPDAPENYHTVAIELEEVGDRTRVTLTQDGNATEEARDHSQRNWTAMLEGLKKVVENPQSIV